MKKILGISAFYHDSAATIVNNGQIIAAAQEERFTRKKHDPNFPANALRFCLDYADLSLDQLDAVVFYDKPMLKFERLLETYYAFSPKGITSFMASIPIWLKEKLFLKKLIYEELQKIESYDRKKLKLLFPEHHLSHAASAFYPSSYKEAAILTIDGVGEWATTSICHGYGKHIKVLKELRFPHSVGLLYSAFTYFLGFKVNSGEYKLMGLAPYGNPFSENVRRFRQIILDNLLHIQEDGSIWLNQDYFDYATGLRMVHEKKWEKIFGFACRKSETNLEQIHCDLGLAIQQITEEIVLKMAQEAQRLTKSENLCLAGGVALNCVANGKLLHSGVFKNIFIQPAAGDAGGSLGAALAANYLYFGEDRSIDENQLDSMAGSYLGNDFSDSEVEMVVKKYKAKAQKFDKFEVLAGKTASLLAEGNIIGWVQGRMEFGPRALGARSILGDARNPEMQKKLNLKIKYREGFRPFAPSVLAEDAQEFFDLNTVSPYMLLVTGVQEKRRKKLPQDYHNMELWAKLYTERSDVQSITHLDFSARVQTVHRETNPRYWELINEFKKLTGYSLIVNTSFNVRGEPIVCTPADAYRCFMRTEMDFLVIGNYIFAKKDQPNWAEQDNWREEFKLD
jgi:carbamoyltransferase